MSYEPEASPMSDPIHGPVGADADAGIGADANTDADARVEALTSASADEREDDEAKSEDDDLELDVASDVEQQSASGVDNRMLCFMPTAALTSTAGAIGRRACPSGVSDDDDGDEYPAASSAVNSDAGVGSDYVVVTQDELRAHTYPVSRHHYALNDESVLRAYLEREQQVKTTTTRTLDSPVSSDEHGRTLLHLAVSLPIPNQEEDVENRSADTNVRPQSHSRHELFRDGEPRNRHLVNRIDVLRLLIMSGANLRSRDKYGATPLHLAAQHGLAPFVRYLLVKGAAPNLRDHEMNTPLHVASSHGVAEALVQFGARLDLKNNFGRLPAKQYVKLSAARTAFKAKADPVMLLKGAPVTLDKGPFLILPKSHWQADSSSKVCRMCSKSFTNRNRRHHCRLCGVLACYKCTSKQLVVPSDVKKLEYSYFSAKRACDSCFNVATHSETRLKLAQEEMEKMPEVEV